MNTTINRWNIVRYRAWRLHERKKISCKFCGAQFLSDPFRRPIDGFVLSPAPRTSLVVPEGVDCAGRRCGLRYSLRSRQQGRSDRRVCTQAWSQYPQSTSNVTMAGCKIWARYCFLSTVFSGKWNFSFSDSTGSFYARLVSLYCCWPPGTVNGENITIMLRMVCFVWAHAIIRRLSAKNIT